MRDVRPTTMAAVVSLLAAMALAGCGSGRGAKPDAAKPDATQCRKLEPNLTWSGDVRQKLQAATDAHSSCTGTFSGSPAPVAIFDWDNTVVKNDIGYGTNYWMLRNDKILQPANQDLEDDRPLYDGRGGSGPEGSMRHRCFRRRTTEDEHQHRMRRRDRRDPR
jgi:hypothetical protein